MEWELCVVLYIEFYTWNEDGLMEKRKVMRCRTINCQRWDSAIPFIHNNNVLVYTRTVQRDAHVCHHIILKKGSYEKQGMQAKAKKVSLYLMNVLMGNEESALFMALSDPSSAFSPPSNLLI